MRLLALAFARFILRTPWASLTSLTGIALGVASALAVHLIGQAVADALDASRPPHLRELSLIAERPGATMADYFDLRRRWRAGQLPGVRGMAPVVEGQLVEQGRRFHLIGADWLGAASAPGSVAPDAYRPNRLLADASLALAEGDELRLGGANWVIAGLVETDLPGALFADIGDALHLLNAPADQLSYVGLWMEDPWQPLRGWLERLLPGLSAGLPTGTQTLAGWTLHQVATQLPGARFSESVLFNLGALGSLALLVAWFLIYQACVLWRRRQDATLECLAALGVGRGQLAGGFLLSIAALAALATLVGAPAGFLLAELLTRVSTAGFEAPPRLQLTAPAILKALASGLGVALIGGWSAFRRRGFAAAPGFGAGRWASLAALLTLAALGIGIEGTGLFGGFAAILAAALATALLVAPLLRLLRHWAARLPGGLLTRLALREATWFEADLSAALGALALAVAASVGVGLMVDSFRLDFQRMLGQRLALELFVELERGDAKALAGALASHAPHAQIQAYGRLRTRIAGHAAEVGHAQFSAAEAARYGHAEPLQGNQALASERMLDALDAEVGDAVQLAGVALRIVGVFPGFGDPMPRLLMPDETAAKLFGALHFDRLSVSGLAPEELDVWLAEHAPGAKLRRRDAMRAFALELFDRTFAIADALTLLALLVAAAGLGSAMTGLRLNRRATDRLLAILGLTAGERRRIELIRSASLGMLALLLALPLGIFMGTVLCGVINPRSFGWTVHLALAPRALAWPAGLGMLAVLLVGLAPAPKERLPAD